MNNSYFFIEFFNLHQNLNTVLGLNRHHQQNRHFSANLGNSVVFLKFIYSFSFETESKKRTEFGRLLCRPIVNNVD